MVSPSLVPTGYLILIDVWRGITLSWCLVDGGSEERVHNVTSAKEKFSSNVTSNAVWICGKVKDPSRKSKQQQETLY
ncbi:MAG: hypothetical protein DWQ00_15395 [Candidatus Scalindua sp.]|nr:MAG: hypothetical protein DWQ00_15395 [Candidatus Scalindua sp.]